MPPIFENDALVTFYRPCWAAHERGPPEGQTITEVNLSHLYPLLTPFNRNSYFAQNGLFFAFSSSASAMCRQYCAGSGPSFPYRHFFAHGMTRPLPFRKSPRLDRVCNLQSIIAFSLNHFVPK